MTARFLEQLSAQPSSLIHRSVQRSGSRSRCRSEFGVGVEGLEPPTLSTHGVPSRELCFLLEMLTIPTNRPGDCSRVSLQVDVDPFGEDVECNKRRFRQRIRAAPRAHQPGSRARKPQTMTSSDLRIGRPPIQPSHPTRPKPKATRNFGPGGFSAPKQRSKLPLDLTELSTAR